MGSWKENKMVAVVSLIMTIAAVGKRLRPMPKVEIDATQSIPGPGKMIK